MKHFARVKVLVSTALLLLPACVWAESGTQCKAPAGARVVENMNDLPAALRQTISTQFFNPSPPRGPFDATDVVINTPPHFSRIMFVWHQDTAWVVAVQHGGIAYSESVQRYTVLSAGATAQLKGSFQGGPAEFCAKAEGLLHRKA